MKQHQLVQAGDSLIIVVFIILMEVINEPTLSAPLRLRLIAQTIFSFSTLLLAAIFTIVLCLQSFSGVASTAPLVLNTCTDSFFSLKYGDVNRSVTIVFFTSVISIILQIIMCILVFPPLLRRQRPSHQRMVSSYALSSLHMLSALIAFAKYLTFRIELNKMTNCDVSFNNTLIAVILAIASADMVASLLQYVASVSIVCELNRELKEGQTYKAVSNLTNYTLESVEEPAKPFIQNTKQDILKQQKILPPPPIDKKDVQKYQSNDQLQKKPYESYVSKHQRELVLQKNPSSPIKPIYKRNNSISQEESFNSLMSKEKTSLRMNRGPIFASNVQENQNSYRTQGYMSYIRKMNNAPKLPTQTEGQLIAVIRGKYAK